MNRDDFNKVVEHVFGRTESVLVKKGAEYSTNTNVFHNFDASTGLSFHNTNSAVAWEFLVKHLQSIKDMIGWIENGDLSKITPNLVEEKFGDAINYLILIEGMIKQRL